MKPPRHLGHLIGAAIWLVLGLNSLAWAVINSFLHNHLTAGLNGLWATACFMIVAVSIHWYVEPPKS